MRQKQARKGFHAWALGASGLLAVCAASTAQAQTAAPALPKPTVVGSGYLNPWAIAPLPDKRFLLTERGGKLWLLDADGRKQSELQGVPKVVDAGQGGLLDVVADSQFASNRRIYFCFSEAGPQAGTNSTALATARIAADERQLDQVKVLFSQRPKARSNAHFGCRIAETPDGNLFLSLGDRFSLRNDAQTLNNHHGKLVRIAKDGSVPKDNPYVGRQDALPEIYSYGHRNSQGLAVAADGSLWQHEHGPQGGDEINRPQPGKNYGWPVITYGEEYGGGKIGEGTQKAGMEQPLHYWVPSIAPSGMAFVTSDRYGPAWKGSLLVGGLKSRSVAQLTVKDGKVTGEKRLYESLGERIRDVRQGADGLVYLLTDGPDGKLIRLTPSGT
ncbi:PQQ-dependent sugar dehydrogenase [Comamonas koreensis]|uniref:PQQ-dependent sugar dehydrogenase n=1 Tax=Comamonas koreensis TaxID=160825 RepID=A0AAW4Y2K5_9BURK|nr:PQQ-dependent sugar dehydrogenase [Comamonas koreensis]MCD2167568.1 PQQ-dependent sugar dehydrogenase [Comamonas koreensis]